MNGIGETHFVEATIVRPVVFGSDIQRYDRVQPEKYIIYPYRGNSLISEQELDRDFPYTLKYFQSYRDLLASRSSITAGGLTWYELVRKRHESWLTRPKLLIRDLAMVPSFALDADGGTLLVGGTAVVPSDPDQLPALIAYLNSHLVEWFLSPITPAFRAEFRKYEPNHLSRIPIPGAVLDDSKERWQLDSLAREVIEAKKHGDSQSQKNLEKEIDSIICRLVGIELSEIM